MRYVFEAVIRPDVELFFVEFPDLDDCYTQGTEKEDAVYMAADALELFLEALLIEGEEIPKATFGHPAPHGGAVVAISVCPDP